MIEDWKPVIGFENIYEVSDQGNVRRIIGGSGSHLGKCLKPRFNTHGYLQVTLCNKPISKTPTVHKLVAEAFLGPRPEGYEVNHKDFDKCNNRLTNIEYVEGKENIKHFYANRN